MIPQDTRGVCIIGGWSDKIFDFISAFEEVCDAVSGTGKGNVEDNVVIRKIKAIRP